MQHTPEIVGVEAIDDAHRGHRTGVVERSQQFSFNRQIGIVAVEQFTRRNRRDEFGIRILPRIVGINAVDVFYIDDPLRADDLGLQEQPDVRTVVR